MNMAKRITDYNIAMEKGVNHAELATWFLDHCNAYYEKTIYMAEQLSKDMEEFFKEQIPEWDDDKYLIFPAPLEAEIRRAMFRTFVGIWVRRVAAAFPEHDLPDLGGDYMTDLYSVQDFLKDFQTKEYMSEIKAKAEKEPLPQVKAETSEEVLKQVERLAYDFKIFQKHYHRDNDVINSMKRSISALEEFVDEERHARETKARIEAIKSGWQSAVEIDTLNGPHERRETE